VQPESAASNPFKCLARELQAAKSATTESPRAYFINWPKPIRGGPRRTDRAAHPGVAYANPGFYRLRDCVSSNIPAAAGDPFGPRYFAHSRHKRCRTLRIKVMHGDDHRDARRAGQRPVVECKQLAAARPCGRSDPPLRTPRSARQKRVGAQTPRAAQGRQTIRDRSFLHIHCVTSCKMPAPNESSVTSLRGVPSATRSPNRQIAICSTIAPVRPSLACGGVVDPVWDHSM
jgi:hypothetical protein